MIERKSPVAAEAIGGNDSGEVLLTASRIASVALRLEMRDLASHCR